MGRHPSLSSPRHFATSLIASLVLAGTAAAQPYPSKPIRLIIPSSPGSGVDFVSRVVAPPLSAELGQQVVTDNRAGAGGIVGAEIAAKAPPNGYTLIMATPSTTINAILHKNMSAEPARRVRADRRSRPRASSC